jgi:hypothetical protein
MDDRVHEKRMEEYVNQKMGTVADAAEEPPTPRSRIAELYQIPELLDVQTTRTDNEEGTTGNAAPLLMNTGIAEVSLPRGGAVEAETRRPKDCLLAGCLADSLPTEEYRRNAEGCGTAEHGQGLSSANRQKAEAPARADRTNASG